MIMSWSDTEVSNLMFIFLLAQFYVHSHLYMKFLTGSVIVYTEDPKPSKLKYGVITMSNLSLMTFWDSGFSSTTLRARDTKGSGLNIEESLFWGLEMFRKPN